MHIYILRRLLQAIPVLFGVSIAVFSIVHLMPGDPATIIAEMEASKSDIEAVRTSLGLDRPLYEQYFTWLGSVLQGDFGRSFRTGRPVSEEIGFGYWNTVLLGVTAGLLAGIVGIILGTITAVRQGGWLDNAVLTLSVLGLSMPTFFLGILLMLIFAVWLGVLPLSGMGSPAHIILPAVTLAVGDAAIVARVMRSNLVETLGQDYVRTARAKGLSRYTIIFGHAVPNALIPVVTVVALQMGSLLGGAVVTETVFAWPGIGRLIVQSIDARDFPVVQASVLLLAVTFVILNVVADIAYHVIDPRMKLQ